MKNFNSTFEPKECYYCKKMINSFADHVEKEIPIFINTSNATLVSLNKSVDNIEIKLLSQRKSKKKKGYTEIEVVEDFRIVRKEFNNDDFELFVHLRNTDLDKNKGKDSISSVEVLVNRDFHVGCVANMVNSMNVQTRLENLSDREKCYYKVKEILGDTHSSDKYIVQRLNGLRTNTFAGKRQNASMVDGYTFDIIYKTILISEPRIRSAMKQIKFNGDKHKINFIMSVVRDNLSSVKNKDEAIKRQERLNRQNELLLSEIVDKQSQEKFAYQLSDEEKIKKEKASERWLRDQERKQQDIDLEDLFN